MKKYLLLVALLSFSLNIFAKWDIEKQKIDYLISEVSKLDAIFIRNGDEHTPKEAVKHLKMKLNNALSSWFAPDKEQWSAELFIERIASRSSFTSESYKLKFPSGKVLTTRSWLLKKLKKYPAKT